MRRSRLFWILIVCVGVYLVWRRFYEQQADALRHQQPTPLAYRDNGAVPPSLPATQSTQPRRIVTRVHKGAPPPVSLAPPTELSPRTGLLNINTASVADLAELPGIDQALATRIVAYRETHGRFGAVAELGAVANVDASTLQEFAYLVTT